MHNYEYYNRVSKQVLGTQKSFEKLGEILVNFWVIDLLHYNFLIFAILIDKYALDLISPVHFSFRSTISTLSFSLKIKSLTKRNMFYRSDILHNFLIFSF